MKGKFKMDIDELTKSNIWTISESELSQMIIEAKKDDHFADYKKHYMNIIRNVFDIQYLNRDDERRVAQLESMHYQIFSSPNEGENNAIAIRKHQVKKVTDLTLENITHLEPYEVLELIKNNMGTGWKGLPLAIQDIIESAFFIDCSVLPTTTMHRAGGIIERRKDDGYEVLEIPRGNWTEGIFVKPKPRIEKAKHHFFEDEEVGGKSKRGSNYIDDDDEDDEDIPLEEEDDDEDLPEIEDEDPDRDEDDDAIDLDDANPDISELEDFIEDDTSDDDD